MKRDIVQLWVTKATRQIIKVLAAKAGLSAVEYLEEHFSAILKGGESENNSGVTRLN